MTKNDLSEHGDVSKADTPTQSKITRFLPARKAREQAAKQISTPAGKRTRGGLVSAGSPDRLSILNDDGTKKEETTCEPETKSPEHKKTRPLLISEPIAQQQEQEEAKQKSSVSAVPAYQRFAHLVDRDEQSIDRLARPHLPLPPKYALLLKLQQALDSSISIAAGRGQRPVWHRLLPALQSSLNRTLTLGHLHLLLSFIPGMYTLEQCKIVEKGRRVDSVFIDIDNGIEDRVRRDALFTSVLKHVEREHANFLESLNIILPKAAELRNWHPRFNLESICDPPNPFATDRLLEKVMVPDMIKEAIEAVTSIDNKPEFRKPDERAKAEEEKTGKKLTMQERIKLKEQQAELEKMAGPTSAKHKLILSSLPGLIDTLSFLFSSSKKTVLFLSVVQERLRQSSSAPWSNEELDERLDTLQKHLPGWITVNRTEAPFTVRIDRSISPKALKEQLFMKFLVQ